MSAPDAYQVQQLILRNVRKKAAEQLKTNVPEAISAYAIGYLASMLAVAIEHSTDKLPQFIRDLAK